MSSIWHDPDFEPIRQFQAPIVTKNFDDLPVPTEVHELPEGVADPFAKLDAAYDVAGAQMERGIKGAEFLHGKAPPRAGEVGPDDVTRLQQRPDRFEPAAVGAASPRAVAQQVQRKELDEQHRRLDQAAVIAVPQGTTNASNNTAAAREAARLANAGGVDGAALTFAPMVAGQLAAAAVPTPLAPAASQAAQLVNTVSAAGEVALAGGAGRVDDRGDGSIDPDAGPRRGIRR